MFAKTTNRRPLAVVVLGVVGAVIVSACTSGVDARPGARVGSSRASASPESGNDTARDVGEIVLPLSLNRLVEADAGSSKSSSARSEAELTDISRRMGEIWAPAGIKFDVRVGELAVPTPALEALARGDQNAFFAALQSGEIELDEPQAIYGFYARGIGGPNGLTPAGLGAFFVTDAPSVHDERVSSHEVGHVLGLDHPREDPGRLMFSGTNGMRLTDAEITSARTAARRISDALNP